MAFGSLVFLISLLAAGRAVFIGSVCPHEGLLNPWSQESTWDSNGKVCLLLFVLSYRSTEF